MISPLMAAKAYANVQGGPAPAATASLSDQGPNFGDMVKTAMNDVVSSSKAAETQMTAQATGHANMVNVVTAVASAQASLQTMMAVRDQVIQAYQQIMAMPV